MLIAHRAVLRSNAELSALKAKGCVRKGRNMLELRIKNEISEPKAAQESLRKALENRKKSTLLEKRHTHLLWTVTNYLKVMWIDYLL